jgi:hypothetical protein
VADKIKTPKEVMKILIRSFTTLCLCLLSLTGHAKELSQAEQLQEFWTEFRVAVQSKTAYPKLEKLISFPLVLGGNIESSPITKVKKSNFLLYIDPVLDVETFDPINSIRENFTIRQLINRYPNILDYRHVKARIREDGSVISPVNFDQLGLHYIKGRWYWKEGFLPEEWCLTEPRVVCAK